MALGWRRYSVNITRRSIALLLFQAIIMPFPLVQGQSLRPNDGNTITESIKQHRLSEFQAESVQVELRAKEAAVSGWKLNIYRQAMEAKTIREAQSKQNCGKGPPCPMGSFCMASDKWAGQGLGIPKPHHQHLAEDYTEDNSYKCVCPLLPRFGSAFGGSCKTYNPPPPGVPTWCLRPLLDSDVDENGNPVQFLNTRVFDQFYNASLVGSPRRLIAHPELDLPLIADFQSCAVVASSNILRYHPKGEEINAHTAIFRFNNAPTKGYEEIVGNRTTVRLHARTSCNLEKSNIAFSLHPQISILRPDKRGKKLKERSTIKPEGDTCETFAEPSQALYDSAYDYWNIKTGLLKSEESFSSGSGTLSHGYAAVLLALQLCGKVDLYGFGRGRFSENYYYMTSTKRRLENMKLEAYCIDTLRKGWEFKSLFQADLPNVHVHVPPAQLRNLWLSEGKLEPKFSFPSRQRKFTARIKGSVNHLAVMYETIEPDTTVKIVTKVPEGLNLESASVYKSRDVTKLSKPIPGPDSQRPLGLSNTTIYVIVTSTDEIEHDIYEITVYKVPETEDPNLGNLTNIPTGLDSSDDSKNDPYSRPSSLSQELLISEKNSSTPRHVPMSTKTKEFMQILRTNSAKPKNGSIDNIVMKKERYTDSQVNPGTSETNEVAPSLSKEQDIIIDNSSKNSSYMNLESYIKLIHQNVSNQISSHQ